MLLTQRSFSIILSKSSSSTYLPKSKTFPVNYSSFFHFIRRKKCQHDLLKQFIVEESLRTIQKSEETAIKFSIWGREKNMILKAILCFFLSATQVLFVLDKAKLNFFLPCLELQGFFHSSFFPIPQQFSSNIAGFVQLFTIIPLDFSPHFL